MKINLKYIAGASFLMASTAIGPGFLTQTSTFTGQFAHSMIFIIIIVVLLDLIVQSNTWRIIGVSGLRGQDIANQILPGLGYFVAILVALGGFAFAIGDIGGAALGMQILFDLSPKDAGLITGLISILIFASKNAKTIMDRVVELLGIFMILAMIYINSTTTASFSFEKAIEPFKNLDDTSMFVFVIITMLGGSCGGYIAFTGGHRLIDAKITGIKNLKNIQTSAFLGVGISATMRFLLFFAVLSVISTGFILDSKNPVASAFEFWGGELGYKLFGVVLFFAAISSIIGGAYASVSFIKTFSKTIAKYENIVIIFFIIFATALVVLISKPISILIAVGTLNGLILPIMLSVIILASFKKSIVKDYKHPKSLIILGIIAIILSTYGGIIALPSITKVF